LGLLQAEVGQKQKTLEACLNGFSVPAYLTAKSKAAIEEEAPKQKKKDKEKTTKDSLQKVSVPNDILHQELYDELRTWRFMLAQEQNVPAYVVLSQMALIGIANMLPQDSTQLLQIPGVGKATLERYGEEILQVVQENVRQHGYELKEYVLMPEPENRKESKTGTKEQTFALYQQGKSIEEIAKERSLAVSTIEGHLLPYVQNGDIPLEKIVPPEKIDRIKEVLQQNPEATFSEIKAILGDDYSYGEIRLVKAVG
jgi:uncharacterized protein YpbB